METCSISKERLENLLYKEALLNEIKEETVGGIIIDALKDYFDFTQEIAEAMKEMGVEN